MRKFKLIKCYPDSPELGFIAKFEDGANECVFRVDSTEFMLSTDFVTLDGCIKYPECWKEVKEIYQILSLKSSQGNISDLLDGDKVAWTWDNYPNFKVATDLLKAGKHFVYSIKRLSDNVVFTIGDIVEHFDSKEDKGVVTKIDIDFNTPLIYFEGTYRGNKEHRFTNSFDVLKHPSKLLFTTEDGVDIYDGDGYFYGNLHQIHEIHPYKGDRFTYEPKVYKYFSTSKAFKGWINMNIPLYSKQQIIEACDKLGWIKGDANKLLTKL
jgi:hypothetical protein